MIVHGARISLLNSNINYRYNNYWNKHNRQLTHIICKISNFIVLDVKDIEPAKLKDCILLILISIWQMYRYYSASNFIANNEVNGECIE